MSEDTEIIEPTPNVIEKQKDAVLNDTFVGRTIVADASKESLSITLPPQGGVVTAGVSEVTVINKFPNKNSVIVTAVEGGGIHFTKSPFRIQSSATFRYIGADQWVAVSAVDVVSETKPKGAAK